MTDSQSTDDETLRIRVEDFKPRLASGEQVTVLDARYAQDWQSAGCSIEPK